MNRLTRWLATLGLFSAVVCALAALGAGLGYRFGWWHFRVGIATLGTVFWVALTTAIVCLVALLLAGRRPGLRATRLAGVLGLAIAAVTAWVPYDLRMTASRVPPIHDISTDLNDPPAFRKVASLRQTGDHPVSYDGPAVAAQQRTAYPDLAPLVFKASPEQVFAVARSSLTGMGLTLVEADPAQGHLEATATSLVFGFKDDVVLRLVAENGGTRVDVRSKSRVGRNDFGMNAKRVRDIAQRMKAALG